MTGSEQALHQDMAVFHIWPCNFLIGAWIACEDVAEGSGPLVLYPGSHRAPFFPGFTQYPQTNLRTAYRETFAATRTTWTTSRRASSGGSSGRRRARSSSGTGC